MLNQKQKYLAAISFILTVLWLSVFGINIDKNTLYHACVVCSFPQVCNLAGCDSFACLFLSGSLELFQ